MLAQRAADEAVAEAQQKSRQLMEDAELHSHKLLAEAESNARQRGESERRRLEQEVLELADRRAALLADVDALGRFEGDFRERMVRALEADLSALQQSAVRESRPGARTARGRASRARRSNRAASRTDAQPGGAGAPSRSSAPTRLRPGRSTWPRCSSRWLPRSTPTPEPSPMAMPPAAATPPPEPPAPEPLEVARESSPIDLLGDDALEADVLDDDAFFATLREAVHDDTPLGPRDEDDDNLDLFNDDNGDRSGFRDVFRRRR